jgi:hypothetical protein
MNRASAITAAVILSLSLSGGPAAWAADPAEPAPAKDVKDPPKTEDVLKTKTRSNQSNDREAAPPPAKDKDATDTPQPAEVLKTKTKSNQSND